MLLLLLHDLLVELSLGFYLFRVAVADVGEVLADLDVAEFGGVVLAGGEVGEALQVLARVHGYRVPVYEFELVHEVKHLGHDLHFKDARFTAPLTLRHTFLRQSVLLSGPHGLQDAVLAQGLQRWHVPDHLLGVLL